MIYIIAVLAVWRLTRLLIFERGPFGIFILIRRMLMKSNELAQALSCSACTSAWIALPFGIALGGRDWLIWWFGVAGGALILLIIETNIEISLEIRDRKTMEGNPHENKGANASHTG